MKDTLFYSQILGIMQRVVRCGLSRRGALVPKGLSFDETAYRKLNFFRFHVTQLLGKGLTAQLWSCKYSIWTMKGWLCLINWMIRTRLVPMKKVATSLKKHLWCFINAVVLNTDNSHAESINSRINMVKTRAWFSATSDYSLMSFTFPSAFSSSIRLEITYHYWGSPIEIGSPGRAGRKVSEGRLLMNQRKPQVKLSRRNLPLLLLAARQAVLTSFRPILRDFDLTEQQWWVLRALSEEGELTIGQIEQHCHLLGPSLSGILKRMSETGLIVRRTDPRDTRRFYISTSDKGVEVFAKIVPRLEQGCRQLEYILGADTVQNLEVMLDQVINNIDAAQTGDNGPDPSSRVPEQYDELPLIAKRPLS